MTNTYNNVEYKKLKGTKDFVSLITVSPQVMAEGDFNGIVLKEDGAGFILDSDNTLIKKEETELKAFIEDYCGLSQEELINDLKNKNGINKMEQQATTEKNSLFETAMKGLNRIPKELLSPKQELRLQELNGKTVSFDLEAKGLKSGTFPKIEEALDENKHMIERSSKLNDIIDDVSSPEVKQESKQNTKSKKRSGLRK